MPANDLFSFLSADRGSIGPRARRRRTGARSSEHHGGSTDVRIHLLDVGTEQYGDCVLLELASRTILVDGGHKSNISAQGQAPSIPTQMEHLLGRRPPFKIDLIVTT